MNKKFLVVLVAIIGFGSSDISAQRNCDCTCLCGSTTLQWSSQASWTNCSSCLGSGVKKTTCKDNCNECQNTGKQRCQGWQNCSSCGGNGCKNGYTTNNGKNCYDGYCGACGGKGGKYVTGRWDSCNNCSLCRGTGYRDVLCDTGCTSCGGNSQRAGTGGKWNSGCKCSRCDRHITNCY